MKNNSSEAVEINVKDNSYGSSPLKIKVDPKKIISSYIDVSKRFGWYDISLQMNENEEFSQTFAGRIENGKPGKTDPLMGREV
jgi:phospholipase C